KPVHIYSKADHKAPMIGWLAGNLRYPVAAQLMQQDQQKWYEISLGGQTGYIPADQCELDQGVPVLTFHHLLLDKENKRFRHTSTTTSVQAFTSQMEFLQQQGYQTISAYELERYINNQINLPGKVVLITFDDGLKSVYRYAYPVLKRLGFEATLFIISSRIKRNPQPWNPNSLQFLSVSELEEMQDICDIQSHTHFMHRVTKNRQPILLVRSYHNILFDFEHSRRALAQFNPHVIFLAYPFGAYNKLGLNAAKEAGFHLAFTTVQGKVRPGDNPFTLKRLYILSGDSLEVMARRLGNERNVPYGQAGNEM
ncbi:MAG: polysaccharide deacetylase family protein, partial [Enterobacteriaceae bacterium]